MRFADFYSDTISYVDTKNLYIGEFQTLYKSMITKLSTKEGQEEIKNKKLQHLMGGLI